MSLLTWDKKYQVGITEFDEQHKKLIELVNKLYDAMREGRGKEALKDILNELIAYTKYHFDSEEKCFSKFDYPDKLEHLEEHNALKQKVVELKKRFDEGNAVISIEVMSFLKQWILEHIQGADKKYGPYLNEKGVN